MDLDSPAISFISVDARKGDWVLVLNTANPISPLLTTFVECLQKQGVYLEMREKMYIIIYFPDQAIDYFSNLYNINLTDAGHSNISTSTFSLQFTRLDLTEERSRFNRLYGATTRERIMIANEALKEARFGDGDMDYGIDKLQALGAVKDSFPLHDSHYKYDRATEDQWLSDRQLLLKYWANFSLWYKEQPLNLIEKYFGNEVAFYFAWLGFYNQMLIPAAIVGLICFIISVIQVATEPNYRTEDICNSNYSMCPVCHSGTNCVSKPLKDSCLYAKVSVLFDNYSTVVYATFMSFWATLFLNRWRRLESLLKIKWNVEDPKMDTKIRREFRENAKHMKVSMVSGKLEPYVPQYIKILRLTLSYGSCLIFITIVLLALFIVVLVKISMATLFDISTADHLESGGAVLVACTAATLQVVFIKLIGLFYARISQWLTKLENPRTQTEFDRSVIYKRYFLGFANNYIPLFYMAFFKGLMYTPNAVPSATKFETDICHPCGCLMAVGIQLFFLMVMNSWIGNILTLIIPKIKGVLRPKPDTAYSTQWKEEYKLSPTPTYLLTTEFMEMAIQYGFVTFFVAAFPLAPLFALLNNCLELRLDAYKLVTRYRRPIPKKQSGIGSWNHVLEVITHLGVATNAFVLAFTSDFVAREIYKHGHNNSLKNYITSTLSMFDMRDYQGQIKGTSFENTVICHYRAHRHPPHHPNKYQLTPYFWYELGIRLVYVIVFEHVIWVSNGILSYFIPDVPMTVKEKIHHDKMMEQSLKMKLMAENNKRVQVNVDTDLFRKLSARP